jgi:hypothetical protein
MFQTVLWVADDEVGGNGNGDSTGIGTGTGDGTGIGTGIGTGDSAGGVLDFVPASCRYPDFLWTKMAQFLQDANGPSPSRPMLLVLQNPSDSDLDAVDAYLDMLMNLHRHLYIVVEVADADVLSPALLEYTRHMFCFGGRPKALLRICTQHFQTSETFPVSNVDYFAVTLARATAGLGSCLVVSREPFLHGFEDGSRYADALVRQYRLPHELARAPRFETAGACGAGRAAQGGAKGGAKGGAERTAANACECVASAFDAASDAHDGGGTTAPPSSAAVSMPSTPHAGP